jgi:hypothetical protein
VNAAQWVEAAATVVVALSSIVAVLTWRDQRRKDREASQRDHETQMGDRILDSARREFSTKQEVGGLKSSLIGLGVIGLVIAALAVWEKLDSTGKDRLT